MSPLDHSPAVDPQARALVSASAARPRRAVIFDFNGTLSDDEPILFSIFSQIVETHVGWSITEAEYRAGYLGRSDREIVENAVHDHAAGDAELTEALVRLRREMYEEVVADWSPITAEAADLVHRLAIAGVPMAIVTGAQRDEVTAVLDNCATGELIGTLVTEEDVAAGKPDPEGFYKAAALLSADPEDVLVFEDSLAGVMAARDAGMRCIAVVGDEPTAAVVAAAPAAVARLSIALLDGTEL